MLALNDSLPRISHFLTFSALTASLLCLCVCLSEHHGCKSTLKLRTPKTLSILTSALAFNMMRLPLSRPDVLPWRSPPQPTLLLLDSLPCHCFSTLSGFTSITLETKERHSSAEMPWPPRSGSALHPHGLLSLPGASSVMAAALVLPLNCSHPTYPASLLLR